MNKNTEFQQESNISDPIIIINNNIKKRIVHGNGKMIKTKNEKESIVDAVMSNDDNILVKHKHVSTNYNHQIFINDKKDDEWKKLSSSASLHQKQQLQQQHDMYVHPDHYHDDHEQQWLDKNSKSTLFETTTMVISDDSNNNNNDDDDKDSNSELNGKNSSNYQTIMRKILNTSTTMNVLNISTTTTTAKTNNDLIDSNSTFVNNGIINKLKSSSLYVMVESSTSLSKKSLPKAIHNTISTFTTPSPYLISTIDSTINLENGDKKFSAVNRSQIFSHKMETLSPKYVDDDNGNKQNEHQQQQQQKSSDQMKIYSIHPNGSHQNHQLKSVDNTNIAVLPVNDIHSDGINHDNKNDDDDDDDEKKKSINLHYDSNNHNQLPQQIRPPKLKQKSTAVTNHSTNRCLSTTDTAVDVIRCNDSNSTKAKTFSFPIEMVTNSSIQNVNYYHHSLLSNETFSSVKNDSIDTMTNNVTNDVDVDIKGDKQQNQSYHYVENKINNGNKDVIDDLKSSSSSSSIFCPAEHDDNHNIIWPLTDSGIMSVQPCPSDEYYGTMFRLCHNFVISSNNSITSNHHHHQHHSKAIWMEPDMSECRLTKLRELHYLVNQHSRKHLIDGLFLLIIELRNLLIKQNIYNVLDHKDSLLLFNSILHHMTEHKIRFDRYDYEQQRTMVHFIQSVIIITDRLLEPINHNVRRNNESIITELIQLISSVRLLMDNLLRAFILACQDGSIEHLNSIIGKQRPFFPSTKNFGINLRYQRQIKPKLITLVQTNQTIDFNDMCNLLMPSSSSSSSSLSSLKETLYNSNAPSTIIVNGMNELDVGVTEIWFNNIFDQTISTTAMAKQNNDEQHEHNSHSSKIMMMNISNQILSISLVPAVSIQVNFEIAPCFEVVFRFYDDDDDDNRKHFEKKNCNNNNNKTIIMKANISEDKYKINSSNFDTNTNNDDGCFFNRHQQHHHHHHNHHVYNESIIKTNKSSSSSLTTVNTIHCARLMISHRKQPIWTIDNGGCRTASYNGTHLRCLCNEPGLIGAVSRWSVVVDNINNNNNTLQLVMNQTTTSVTIVNGENNLLESSMDNDDDMTTDKTYYRHNNNNIAARIIRSSGFHISPGTMAPSSHHFLYDIILYTSLISSVIFFSLTLIIQYRLRHYETRETFFIIRNLVIALLLIQLTFLLGTTIHMDLFWIRVEQLSTGFETTAFSNQIKHILCLSVPIFLHFIHLASMFWMLSHTILLYQRMWRRHKEPSSTAAATSTSSLSANISINSQNPSHKLQTKRRRHPFKTTSSSTVNDIMTMNELGAFSHECRRKFLKKLKTQNHHQIMMANIMDEKSIDQQQHDNNGRCSIFQMIKRKFHKFCQKNVSSKFFHMKKKSDINGSTRFNENNNNSLSKINVPFSSLQQQQHQSTEMSNVNKEPLLSTSSSTLETKSSSLSMKEIKTNLPTNHHQKCSLSSSSSTSLLLPI
nr:MATH and LRR domain-containing protein PFE0570w-like [Dermatophagoides farinae]